MRRCAFIMMVGAVYGADQPAAQAPQPDPTAAIVAEGRFIYRQRDVDALVMIAKRHAHGRLSDAEQEAIRQAVVRMTTAREALVDAMTSLPPSYGSKARDALILDVLNYQAEVASRPVETGTAPSTTATSTSKDPVLVRLPPLTLQRVIKGQKRQLVLGLALHFRDPELAHKLEAQAPVVQDAILSTAQKLSDALFTDPDQVAIKELLVKAVQAAVAEFPADGILIPQLDAGEPTVPESSK